MIFMKSDIWSISNMSEIWIWKSDYPSSFPYLKHLQAIDPSFVTITKPLANKTGET